MYCVHSHSWVMVWWLQGVRYGKMWVRTKSTVSMVASFILVIYCGHVPLMFMIFGIQVCDVAALCETAAQTEWQAMQVVDGESVMG